MKAEEARKISFEHSKRMQQIYRSIEESARRGNNELGLTSINATAAEIQVLRDNGYLVTYETSDTDGGQYLLIKW